MEKINWNNFIHKVMKKAPFPVLKLFLHINIRNILFLNKKYFIDKAINIKSTEITSTTCDKAIRSIE